MAWTAVNLTRLRSSSKSLDLGSVLCLIREPYQSERQVWCSTISSRSIDGSVHILILQQAIFQCLTILLVVDDLRHKDSLLSQCSSLVDSLSHIYHKNHHLQNKHKFGEHWTLSVHCRLFKSTKYCSHAVESFWAAERLGVLQINTENQQTACANDYPYQTVSYSSNLTTARFQMEVIVCERFDKIEEVVVW